MAYDDGKELEEESVGSTERKLFASKTERERVFAQLKAMGVAFVTVDFSGSGDDGNVQDVIVSDHTGAKLEGLTLSMPDKSLVFNEAKGWQVENGVGQVPVADAIERLFWLVDAGSEVDWCNNDGGFGELTLNVDVGTIEVTYNVNETISSVAAIVEIS